MKEYALDNNGEVVDEVRIKLAKVMLQIRNERRMPTIIELLRKCYNEEVLSDEDHAMINDILGL